MPGNYQLSVDTLVEEVGAARDLGIKAFILFGIPEYKDATGSSALEDEGIVQQALRALRKAHGTDVLLDHRRVLLRVHRPRPLRHPVRPRRHARRGQRRDAAAPGRSSASATPAPGPTWSPRAA